MVTRHPPHPFTNSTLRLFAFPAGVSFPATGWLSPRPSASIRAASIPNSVVRAFFTAVARRLDRSRLAAASPSESVCPTIRTLSAGNEAVGWRGVGCLG